jgi:hypothetical protein
MGNGYSVNPDCSADGTVVVRVLKEPAHGTFGSRTAMVFPSFPSENPRAHCDSRRVSGQEQTYKSKPGYTGPDDLEFEFIYPHGDTKRIDVALTVIP